MGDLEKWKKQCQYLQVELESTKQQLEDAKILINLNKQQLQVCYQPLTQTATTKLLKFVMEENQFLLQKLSHLSEERNQAFDKAFIVEQINESNQKQESVIIAELSGTIADLKIQLSKQQQIDQQQMGVIFVDKYLTTIDQTNMLFNHKTNLMNSMLLKYRLQIEEITEQKNELAQLNFCLSNEILKMKTQRFTPKAQPRTFCIRILIYQFLQMKTLNTLQRIQCNKKLFFDDESIDEKNQLQQSGVFSPLFSPQLPQKVKKQGKMVNQQPQEVVDKFVPKLDLGKAQQIQQYNIKRIQLMQSKITSDGIETKLMQTQEELIKTRNKYHVQLVLNQQLDLCLTEYSIKLRELQHVNETLIKSNKAYEEKWCKFFTQYQYYQEFYLKFKDAVTQKAPLVEDFQFVEFEKLNNNISNSHKVSQLYTQNRKNQTGHSILNYNNKYGVQNFEDNMASQILPTDRIEEIKKEASRNYQAIIFNIAKDLTQIDLNKAVKSVSGAIRIKRSNSNTLEYQSNK